MDKKQITLYFSGEQYHYWFYPQQKKVCTIDFPDIPVEKLILKCGKAINHDTLVQIIEYKIKEIDSLYESFS